MSISEQIEKLGNLAKSTASIWLLAAGLMTGLGYLSGKYLTIEDGATKGAIAYECLTKFKEDNFEETMHDECIDFYSVYLIAQTNKEAIDWGLDLGFVDVNKNIEELKKNQKIILDKLNKLGAMQ